MGDSLIFAPKSVTFFFKLSYATIDEAIERCLEKEDFIQGRPGRMQESEGAFLSFHPATRTQVASNFIPPIQICPHCNAQNGPVKKKGAMQLSHDVFTKKGGELIQIRSTDFAAESVSRVD